MRAMMMVVSIMLLTGLIVMFGLVDEASMPPIINVILGNSETEYSWYDYLKVWNFGADDADEDDEESGWLSFIANALTIVTVGGATAIGVITKNDMMIYGTLIVTIGMWFTHIWWAIITTEFMMQITPLNYFIFGMVSLVFWWSLIEWLRGKL